MRHRYAGVNAMTSNDDDHGITKEFSIEIVTLILRDLQRLQNGDC